MRLVSIVIGVVAVFLPVAAYAQAEDLSALSGDDGQWVLPTKNYATTRFSTLNKITPENVKNLKIT